MLMWWFEAIQWSPTVLFLSSRSTGLTSTDPMFVSHSTVELYRAAADDIDVARAAWVSQNAESHRKEGEPGRIAGLIDFLWRNGHHSPFEHGQFTFIITTPIFVARELMRHRSSSFNEISGRYTVLPHQFYVPDAQRPLTQSGKVGAYTFAEGSPEQIDLVRSSITESSAFALRHYTTMLEAGVAKEVARDVLPVNTMTSLWMTLNPRNLMHVLDLRTAPDALYEIREVATAMENFFAEKMPLTHAAWKAHPQGR